MDDVRPPIASSLYEADEHAWYFVQIAALRENRLHDLDRENLAEFLADVSKRELREIESRFRTLLVHLLKTIHQPQRLSRSWIVTILREQDALRTLFGYSATLARAAPELLHRVYSKAVRAAEIEIGMPRGSMRQDQLWSVEQVLAYEPPPPA